MDKEQEALGRQEVAADDNAAPSTATQGPPRAAYLGQTYNTMTPAPLPCPVVNHAYTPGLHPSIVTGEKSLLEAYLLWLVFGLMGGHHFYLKRHNFGIVYLLTSGLCGCGWLIDMFRMPWLVDLANREMRDPDLRLKKNISDAYTLWFPLGLLGYHHFYLRNHVQGALYFCTGGLFGVGWLVDLVRIPSMVKATNEDTGYEKREKSVAVAYLCAISPLGIFGGHHFYLQRPNWGLLYAFTHGLCGIGWLVDWFRVPLLVRRANKQIVLGPDQDKHLDDAYLLWFPFGFLGLHHFYLNRPVWGIMYFFTAGLCGVGWLVDIFRMPCLVKDANTLIRERQQLPISQAPNTGIVVTATTGPDLGYRSTGLYPQQQPPQVLSYPPPYQLPAVPGPAQMPAYMEQPPPYSPAGGAQTTAGGATTTTSGSRTSDEKLLLIGKPDYA